MPAVIHSPISTPTTIRMRIAGSATRIASTIPSSRSRQRYPRNLPISPAATPAKISAGRGSPSFIATIHQSETSNTMTGTSASHRRAGLVVSVGGGSALKPSA